jgi:hypothetical protein
MNPAYISALAALIGTLIGGLTSFASSWLTQRTQLRFTHREAVKSARAALYVEFINEATRLLADALEHQKDEIEPLVKLVALTARMRLVSPRPVIVAANQAVDAIIAVYLGPNYALRDLLPEVQRGGFRFFDDFGEACRTDLGL